MDPVGGVSNNNYPPVATITKLTFVYAKIQHNQPNIKGPPSLTQENKPGR